jgi:hypothetical protein
VKGVCSLAVHAERLEIGCDLHGDHTEELAIRADAFEPVEPDVKGACSSVVHAERREIGCHLLGGHAETHLSVHAASELVKEDDVMGACSLVIHVAMVSYHPLLSMLNGHHRHSLCWRTKPGSRLPLDRWVARECLSHQLILLL